MPRCTDGNWCVDDLCHWGSRTLCGVEAAEYDPAGEFHRAEDEDPYYDPDHDWDPS